ncbi:MAG: hypothetical protein ABIJ39_03380, partial [Chloroflexota bacterium]
EKQKPKQTEGVAKVIKTEESREPSKPGGMASVRPEPNQDEDQPWWDHFVDGWNHFWGGVGDWFSGTWDRVTGRVNGGRTGESQSPTPTATASPTETPRLTMTPTLTPSPSPTATATPRFGICETGLDPRRNFYERLYGFDDRYQAGYSFYQRLDTALDGWWHNYQGDLFGWRTYVAIIFNYEVNTLMTPRYEYQVEPYREAVEYLTEAFARRFWQAMIEYGPDGGFWYAGSRQVVTGRAYNEILDVNEGDHDMAQAYERAGMILNPTDADWCNGARWDRPQDWGNPTAETLRLLPLFRTALENGDIGPRDNQILFISEDNQLFIVTQGQAYTLCGNQSCVRPGNHFPSQSQTP